MVVSLGVRSSLRNWRSEKGQNIAVGNSVQREQRGLLERFQRPALPALEP